MAPRMRTMPSSTTKWAACWPVVIPPPDAAAKLCSERSRTRPNTIVNAPNRTPVGSDRGVLLTPDDGVVIAYLPWLYRQHLLSIVGAIYTWARGRRQARGGTRSRLLMRMAGPAKADGRGRAPQSSGSLRRRRGRTSQRDANTITVASVATAADVPPNTPSSTT